MAHLQVISTRVAGICAVEEVVVNGDSRSYVGGPADTEGFVVFRKDVVGYRDVRGVASEINQAVVHARELSIVNCNGGRLSKEKHTFM